MEKIRIIFLGTANAIPTEKRNHTAFLLSYKSENILVDCGEGTQRQFRIAKISPNKITKLLITHWHGDHVFGIPGIFQTMAMQNYEKTLDIFGPKNTLHHISLLSKIFNLKIKYNTKEETGKVFENDEFFLIAEEMSHGIQTYAYSFVLKDKLRLDKKKLQKLKLPNSPLLKELAEGKDVVYNGKIIKYKKVSFIEKGRKVTFILDTSLNTNAIKLAKNSDLLISEATFSSKEKKLAREHNHLTAEDAAKIAKKAKVKKLVLTHVSQRYGDSAQEILKEAKNIFKNTILARDFDIIEI